MMISASIVGIKLRLCKHIMLSTKSVKSGKFESQSITHNDTLVHVGR